MNNLKRIAALILTLTLALSTVGAFAATTSVAIDATAFPDEAFRSYVQKTFDENQDGMLSSSEIKKATVINVGGKKAIQSLNGIQYFTALKGLICYGTSITTLDLSKNTNLLEVEIDRTPLNFLNLGTLKKLHILEAWDTQLASIDISGCTKLIPVVNSPIDIDGSIVKWDNEKGNYIEISTSTKLMNGTKVLRQYAKPTSIKFSKSSVSIKKDAGYDLLGLLKFTPSTSYYKVTFKSNLNSTAPVDEYGWVYGKRTNPVAATITAKCGGKTAQMKVKVK